MSELQAMTGSLGPCVSGHGSQLTCIPRLPNLNFHTGYHMARHLGGWKVPQNQGLFHLTTPSQVGG